MKRISNSITTGISISLFCILGLLPIQSWAQENIFNVSNTSFAEKIYLQLDRKVYTNGDTVWFKCIVANAGSRTKSGGKCRKKIRNLSI